MSLSRTNKQSYAIISDVNGTALAVSGDGLPVTVTGDGMTVSNNGTFVVQENGAALTALQSLDGAVYIDDTAWTQDNSKHNLIGGVYQATPTTIGDGDTGPIRIDADGAVHISDGGNSITVDNTALSNTGDGALAGTLRVTIANDDPVRTAVQLLDNTIIVDDAAFTPGTTSVNMMGATFDDTIPDVVDEGDAGAVRMSSNRNLYVNLRDADGNERGLNIDSLNKIGVTLSGALQAGVDSHAESNTGISALAVRKDTQATLTTTDGNYAPLQVDNLGGLYLASLPTGTNTIGTARVRNVANNTLDIDASGITSLSGTVITASIAQSPSTATGILGSTISQVDPYTTTAVADSVAAMLRSDKYGSLRISDTTCTSGIRLGTLTGVAAGSFIPASNACTNISKFNKITLLGRAYNPSTGAGTQSQLTVYGSDNAVGVEGPSGNLFETTRVIYTDTCGLIDMSLQDFAFPFITFKNSHASDACFNLVLGGR